MILMWILFRAVQGVYYLRFAKGGEKIEGSKFWKIGKIFFVLVLLTIFKTPVGVVLLRYTCMSMYIKYEDVPQGTSCPLPVLVEGALAKPSYQSF